MKSMESFNNVNSPEYRKLLSEQNNIITKLQSLQTELTNSNYEKQNNLESLSSEVIELQKRNKIVAKNDNKKLKTIVILRQDCSNKLNILLKHHFI